MRALNTIAIAVAAGIGGFALGVFSSSLKSTDVTQQYFPSTNSRTDGSKSLPNIHKVALHTHRVNEVPDTNAPLTDDKPRENKVRQRFLDAENQRREAKYTPFLAGLGLDDAQIKEITSSLKYLHEQAMVVGEEAVMPLAQERHSYDQAMQALLGKEGYKKYREFEKEKPYRREIEHLAKEATKAGLHLDNPSTEQLVELFEQHNVLTLESWDGPYDLLPSPLVGEERVIAKNEELLRQVSDGYVAIQASDLWQQLSDEAKRATAHYMNVRIAEFEGALVELRLSPEERERRLHERVRARRGRP